MSPGTAAQDHNILDTVAQRPAASPAKPSPTRFVWLLLPLIAAVGWALSSRLKPVATPPATPVPVVAVAPTPQPPAPAAPPATQVPPASDTSASPAASAPGGTQTNPFGALASTSTAEQLPAPGARPEAVAKPAVVALPTVETPVAARKPAAKPPAKATTPPATKLAATARPKPASTKTPAKTTVAARSSTRKADPDVELLSAIMKHLDDGAGKAAAPARSAQTIAELVKSCQSRDAIEALLCQRRICEGSWGKAQACPVHLAPKSTAKTSTQ
jgi:hypothetical protein